MSRLGRPCASFDGAATPSSWMVTLSPASSALNWWLLVESRDHNPCPRSGTTTRAEPCPSAADCTNQVKSSGLFVVKGIWGLSKTIDICQ